MHATRIGGGAGVVAIIVPLAAGERARAWEKLREGQAKVRNMWRMKSIIFRAQSTRTVPEVNQVRLGVSPCRAQVPPEPQWQCSRVPHTTPHVTRDVSLTTCVLFNA